MVTRDDLVLALQRNEANLAALDSRETAARVSRDAERNPARKADLQAEVDTIERHRFYLQAWVAELRSRVG